MASPIVTWFFNALASSYGALSGTLAFDRGAQWGAAVSPGSHDLTMYDAGRRVVRPVEITGAPAEIIIAGD